MEKKSWTDGEKMPINPYEEKKIRNSIISKINPKFAINKRSKHDKGYIVLDGKVVGKVKIPNNHNRLMKKKKSKYIARDLHLRDDEFNDLISCLLTGTQYYSLLRERGF